MRLLAIDPGGTTGWAFFLDTKLTKFGSVTSDDFLYWLRSQTNVDKIIVEGYIIDVSATGFNHRFDKGETLQKIGAIKYHCYVNEIDCIEQQRSIKVPASGMMFGKPYKKGQKEKQHHYDAILHGGYYLMTKCKAKPEDFKTT